MEILINADMPNTCGIHTLKVGNAFKYQNRYFIRTDANHGNKDFGCIELSTGILHIIEPEAIVVYLPEAKLMVGS